MDGETLKAEAIQLIESHIDLSEAFAEVMKSNLNRSVINLSEQAVFSVIASAFDCR